MPVTIKQGELKYKDPSTGNYVGINTVAEETTATQISQIQSAGNVQKTAVQNAGAAQVAAIEAKGVEVRHSIPGDYSNLSADVEELKDDVTLSSGGIKTIEGFSGVTTIVGNVNTDGTFNDTATGFVRTNYIRTMPMAELTASLKGYGSLPVVAYYDEDRTYLSNASIISNEESVKNIDTMVPNGATYVVFVSQTNYSDREFSIEAPKTIGETVGTLGNSVWALTNATQDLPEIRGDIDDLETDVTAIKSALSESTSNIFDTIPLQNAQGVSVSNGEFIATALALRTAFGASGKKYPLTGFKANTQYTFSAQFKTESNVDNNGLQLVFVYTDETRTVGINVKNNQTEWLQKRYTTTSNKTLDHIEITYGNEANAVWHIKNIVMVEGLAFDETIPHITATDYLARSEVIKINDTIKNNFHYADADLAKKLAYSDRLYVDVGKTKAIYQISAPSGVWIRIYGYNDAEYTETQSFESGTFDAGSTIYYSFDPDVYNYYFRIVFGKTGNFTDAEISNCTVRQLIANEGYTEKDFANDVLPIAAFSRNKYNPILIEQGVYVNTTDGSKSYDNTNYNAYKILVPTGKQVLCSAIVKNVSTSVETRKRPYSTRSFVVFDKNGNFVEAASSDSSAYNYKNNSGADRYVYFNIWSDSNPYYTVRDLMMEIIDVSININAYVLDAEYIPYGVVLTDTHSLFIPEKLHQPRKFFEDEVEETVHKIVGLQNEVNYTFAFVTDTHYDLDESSFPYNHRYTIDTFSNLRDISNRVPLDAVIHGGDFLKTLNGGETQEYSNEYINIMRAWMLECNVNGRVHITPGNHDGINGAPPVWGSIYSSMLKQDERFVVRDGVSPNFYYDIAKPKLRVIFACDINSPGTNFGFTNDTLTWLTSTLFTVPTGYNVILVSHTAVHDSDFTVNKTATIDLLNAWNDHTGDFTSNTGVIVAWIVGHKHCDWIVPTSYSGCDFPIIISTCSLRSYNTPTAAEVAAGAVQVSPRTPLTVSQDAWTIFVYVPSTGMIHKIRFGAGEDEDIDYANWDTQS